jgi:predicted nucleic acid-binding protein
MICFDTMVLVWGIQGKASPGQEEMVARTKRYIDSLRDENEQILIPAPVVSEYLQHFDTDERKRQIRALERYFLLPAFNLPAAYLAAGIAYQRQRSGATSAEGTSRQAIKTDIQILATAIVNNARLLVTHNLADFENLAQLAGGRIRVADVPNVHSQRDLDL